MYHVVPYQAGCREHVMACSIALDDRQCTNTRRRSCHRCKRTRAIVQTAPAPWKYIVLRVSAPHCADANPDVNTRIKKSRE
jgi:hypothetical protein